MLGAISTRMMDGVMATNGVALVISTSNIHKYLQDDSNCDIIHLGATHVNSWRESTTEFPRLQINTTVD